MRIFEFSFETWKRERSKFTVAEKMQLETAQMVDEDPTKNLIDLDRLPAELATKLVEALSK